VEHHLSQTLSRSNIIGNALTVDSFNATSTTATSTIAGGLDVLAINQTGQQPQPLQMVFE
jgi:hypothetical protein